MTDMCMQMLLGGQANGLASMGNLKDRLAQLAQSNPQLAPLAQQLQNRFFAAPMSVEEVHGENSDESDSLVEPEILDPVDAPHAKHRKLETLAKRMYSELKVMRGRNRRLAEALGACHFCWGDDQSCEYCSGDGGIGAFQINPKVFTEVVGPAMQQVRQRPPLAKSQTTNKGEGNHAGL